MLFFLLHSYYYFPGVNINTLIPNLHCEIEQNPCWRDCVLATTSNHVLKQCRVNGKV